MVQMTSTVKGLTHGDKPTEDYQQAVFWRRCLGFYDPQLGAVFGFCLTALTSKK